MKYQIEKILDAVTGKKEELFTRYKRLYEKENTEEVINCMKKTVLQRYIIIIAAGIMVLVTVCLQYKETADNMIFEGNNVKSIIRSEDKSFDYELKVKVKGRNESQIVTVHIEPKSEETDENITQNGTTSEKNDVSDDVDYKSLVDMIEENPAKNEIILPTCTDDGIPVIWTRNKDYTWLFIGAVTVAILLYIYRNRFEKLEKEEKEAKTSILLELPQFINKNILLLNGGLVITDAFERIVTEHQKSGEDENYFYKRLNEIYLNSKETNIPIEAQISDFARTSGIREFIRIATVINDNVCKGTSLIESLESESEYLWFSRKKKAEELGRIAETKMTFPLVILLIILIVITISPAMLEM